MAKENGERSTIWKKTEKNYMKVLTDMVLCIVHIITSKSGNKHAMNSIFNGMLLSKNARAFSRFIQLSCGKYHFYIKMNSIWYLWDLKKKNEENKNMQNNSISNFNSHLTVKQCNKVCIVYNKFKKKIKKWTLFEKNVN